MSLPYFQSDRLNKPSTLRLTQLPPGTPAQVERLVADVAQADGPLLTRLGELGFIPGEPVQLLVRGPGGREPLAVLVGETMFALRWIEAHCVEVSVCAQTQVAAA